MTIKRTIVFTSFILWLLSQAANAFGETVTDYYPLNDGNTWTYRVTGPLGVYQETDTVLPGTTLINGIQTKEIINTGTPDGDVYLYRSNDAHGIKTHAEYLPLSNIPPTWLIYKPPLILANATMNIGQIINSNGEAKFIIDGYGTFILNYELTIKLESIETVVVPAGTYEAVKLSYSDRIYGYLLGEWFDFRSTEENWVAKYVGWVKGVYQDSDGIETRELISTNVTPPPAKPKSPFLPFLPLLLD